MATSGKATAGTSKKKWQLSWSAVVVTVFIWAGIGMLLYPTISNWFYQYNQSKIVKSLYTEAKNILPPVEQNLQLAHQYNDALQFGAKVEADHRLPTGFGKNSNIALDYNHILRVNEDGMMGRIRVPKADVDLPIYHGTSDDVLLKGIGHLEGTSLPVGGPGTHTVVTGHRGLASALMFTNLDKVQIGDTFTFEILGEVLTYQVTEINVVEPHDTHSLVNQTNKDLATLITCTPLGINSHRILVTGERIVPTPIEDINKAGQESELPHFPWWTLIITASLIAGGIFIWKSGYPPAPKKKKKPAQQTPPATNELQPQWFPLAKDDETRTNTP